MSESNAYKNFRDNVLLPGDRIDRVENAIVSGMPDINFCISGTEGWIELKSPIEPKRSSTKLFGSNHKISQDQKNWFKRQLKAGGIAWLLISTDKRWMLISGRYIDEINDLTVEQLQQISKWHTTKPIRGREEWKNLQTILEMAQN